MDRHVHVIGIVGLIEELSVAQRNEILRAMKSIRGDVAVYLLNIHVHPHHIHCINPIDLETSITVYHKGS